MLHRASTRLRKKAMITYGPFTWAEGPHEDFDDKVNYIHIGSYPIGTDQHGIPIDDRGIQCLDHHCIVHPYAKVLSKRILWRDGIVLKVPNLESARQWFDENYVEISREVLLKYCLRWVLKNNMPDKSRRIAYEINQNGRDKIYEELWNE